MKFSIKKELLLENLNNVSKAVSSKNVIPVLGGIKFNLTNEGLFLTATNNEIDIAKTMMMCLIHDIVEIYAGDTYAYDPEGKKTQKEREEKAKEKIYSLLPEDQKKELIALFDEFEAQETPESQFARAMDNIQPMLLNNANNGIDWKNHNVKAEQVYARQTGTKKGSDPLYELANSIIQENIRKGNLGK